MGALTRRSTWTEARNPSSGIEMATYANTSKPVHSDRLNEEGRIHRVNTLSKGRGEHLEQYPKGQQSVHVLEKSCLVILAVAPVFASFIFEPGGQ